MTATVGTVTVRPYQANDAEGTLAVFLDAVTVTASNDYSPEQVAAWSAPQERDLTEWNLARTGLGTVVAISDGELAGFSDVSADGYTPSSNERVRRRCGTASDHPGSAHAKLPDGETAHRSPCR